MLRNWLRVIGLLMITTAFISLLVITRASAGSLRQIPTGSIPTVTGSPVSAVAIVLDSEQGFANVRSGPGTLGYEVVGVLVEGQQVPVVGRTVVGDWLLIAYPGVPSGVAWVWKDLVELRGNAPVVESPATNTPRVTPTIDPTLAAQFLVNVQPTRLPTFTPPEPLSIPTFLPVTSQAAPGNVPIGFIIIGMAVLGIFGLLISFLRGR